jgi:hypothetical protein
VWFTSRQPCAHRHRTLQALLSLILLFNTQPLLFYKWRRLSNLLLTASLLTLNVTSYLQQHLVKLSVPRHKISQASVQPVRSHINPDFKMSAEVLSANPFSDKYASQSAMFYDLTFDPRDNHGTVIEEVNALDIQWETLLAAPTKSALLYDASYDPRDNRVPATSSPCETHALCETLSSAPTNSALFYDASYDARGGKTSLADEDNNLVATYPEMNDVPILQKSPPSSRSSSLSLSTLDTGSTAPTSPVVFNTPFAWENEDVMYLLSVLKPEELMHGKLVFTPSLDKLDHAVYPIHLQLHNKKGDLLAESNDSCDSPNNARRSLTSCLLRNSQLVSEAIDKYNVLWTLHSVSSATLLSIQRAMRVMMSVSETEWTQRLMQLNGYVADGSVVPGVGAYCIVEARLEYYLLDCGKGCLEDWGSVVGVVLRMSEEDRKENGKVYGEAAVYLGRAYEELIG